MRTLLLCCALFLAACGSSPWAPAPLADGYQIMVMNSAEVYVADPKNELLLGTRIRAIGLGPGIIVVDCGDDKVVVNGFANTAGLNLIDTKTGAVSKGLTDTELEHELAELNKAKPSMRPLSSYLKN